MAEVTKRLLVVSQYFWPEEFRINELTQALSEKNYEVVVLTGLPNYPSGFIFQEYTTDRSRYSAYNNVSVVRVPIIPRRRGNMSLLLNYVSFVLSALVIGSWRLRNKKFDGIFVFQTDPITVAIPAIFLKYLKKAPVSMWVLDSWPHKIIALGMAKSRAMSAALGLLVSAIYSRLDKIFVQSRSYVGLVSEYNKTKQPIVFLPQWIENEYTTEPIKKSNFEVPISMQPYTSKFIVLFAGNLGKSQDLNSVLEAISLTSSESDLIWLFAGDGNRKEEFAKGLRLKGLESNAVLLGRHQSSEMPSFFAHANALLVSLRGEEVFKHTIPGKIQSYLAASKPILGMLDGEGSQLISESGAGLVCGASDYSSLAQNAVKLMNMSTSELNQMGNSGYDYGRKHFDRDKIIAQLIRELPFNKCE